MRFAWFRKTSPAFMPGYQSAINRVLFVGFNVVYWVPVVLPIAGVIDYRACCVGFTAIIVTRLVLNLYRNNVLTPQQAVYFPFRAP